MRGARFCLPALGNCWGRGEAAKQGGAGTHAAGGGGCQLSISRGTTDGTARPLLEEEYPSLLPPPPHPQSSSIPPFHHPSPTPH